MTYHTQCWTVLSSCANNVSHTGNSLRESYLEVHATRAKEFIWSSQASAKAGQDASDKAQLRVKELMRQLEEAKHVADVARAKVCNLTPPATLFPVPCTLPPESSLVLSVSVFHAYILSITLSHVHRETQMPLK